MTQFEITIRNDKTRFYDRFALFIFLLNGVGLLLTLHPLPGSINRGRIASFFIGFPILLIVLPAVVVTRNLAKKFNYIILSTAILALSFWIVLGYWWIGIAFLLMIVLYLESKRELKIRFESNAVIYPSFLRKKIDWQDLSNVVLKDRLLTIDFKNNKLLQQDIDAKSYDVNEKDFNEFCKGQIRK